MNPKHLSWLDERNAWGSNMASNNEMGITSVVFVCVGVGGGGCELALLWMLTDRDQHAAHRRSTNNLCIYMQWTCLCYMYRFMLTYIKSKMCVCVCEWIDESAIHKNTTT